MRRHRQPARTFVPQDPARVARLLGLVDAADPPGRGSGRPERDHAEAASVGAQRDLVGARDLDMMIKRTKLKR